MLRYAAVPLVAERLPRQCLLCLLRFVRVLLVQKLVDRPPHAVWNVVARVERAKRHRVGPDAAPKDEQVDRFGRCADQVIQVGAQHAVRADTDPDLRVAEHLAHVRLVVRRRLAVLEHDHDVFALHLGHGQQLDHRLVVRVGFESREVDGRALIALRIRCVQDVREYFAYCALLTAQDLGNPVVFTLLVNVVIDKGGQFDGGWFDLMRIKARGNTAPHRFARHRVTPSDARQNEKWHVFYDDYNCDKLKFSIWPAFSDWL